MSLPVPVNGQPPRLWLTTMFSAGNEENLREMIEPIKGYLDGVVAVAHYPLDGGAAYVETVKGAGKVLHREWIMRHDVSMTCTLQTGLIEEGDIVIWSDVEERPLPDFVAHIKDNLYPIMLKNGIRCACYYYKAYVFIYDELVHYQQSPHWGIVEANPAIELSQYEPKIDIRVNMRPFKRTDPFHWVGHYLGYFMYPAGSNQAALGLDKGQNREPFHVREARRLEFRRELRRRGYPVTLDGAKAMLASPLDQTLKDYINSEKVYNDAYRLFVLKDTTVRDTHDPADMKRID